MNKKELWRRFMKTGKVTDYISYENAQDEDDYPDEELTQEFAEEFINNYDSDFPVAEEYRNDNQNGRYRNT